MRRTWRVWFWEWGPLITLFFALIGGMLSQVSFVLCAIVLSLGLIALIIDWRVAALYPSCGDLPEYQEWEQRRRKESQEWYKIHD